MIELRIAKDFSLPLDVVTESVGILANKGSGKTYTSAKMVERMHEAAIPVVVLDHAGVYWGLTSSADGGPGLPFYVLGGDHGDLPLEPSAGAFVADLVVDSGHSFVLDVSLFDTASDERKFVSAFAQRLYRRKAKHKTPLHVLIDEADEYAPQKPMGVEGNTVKRAIEQLVRRGRTRGIGTTLISQRSAVLNKDVLNMIETLIVLRTVAPGDQEAIRKWISDKQLRDDSGVMESLNKLPTGEAWVWSPLRGILERIKVDRIRTFDSYRTPKPGEAVSEPTARAELDLAALGEQMQATVERAKENDPAELRRRIASLERDLAARPVTEPEVREVPVEVRVEVPVLDAETLDRASDLALQLDAAASSIGESAKEVAEAILAVVQVVQEQKAKAAPVPRRPLPDKPAAAPPQRSATRNGGGPAETDPRVSRSQQAILDALAWFEALGFDSTRRPPLAAIAGTRATSGGFKANVSTLSGLGLIHYPTTGRVALTEAGRALAEPSAIPANERALQDAICDRVSGPQAAILRALIDADPHPLDRESLADAVGVPSSSGGFKANVSTLSGYEFLVYPSPGYVKAAPTLFLGRDA